MSEQDDELPAAEAWIKHAVCGDIEDPELFFSTNPDHMKEAIGLCHQCPVRMLCAEYAIDNEIEHGIWGGLTELDRRSIRKQKASRRGIPNKQH
jgi:WhiB family redox-sensing transcriptional regulator